MLKIGRKGNTMKINKHTAIILAVALIVLSILHGVSSCMFEPEPPVIIANPYNTVSEYE